MILRLLTITGLSVILAACGATTSQNSAVTETPKAEAVQKVEEKKPAEEKVAALPKPAEEKKIEAKPEPKIELPPVDVLNGKSASVIASVFGEPVLKRKDKPAEVWQYLTAKCALHLVFYPEKDSDVMKVRYFSMNERDKAKSSEKEQCFESQLRRVGVSKAKALS